MATRDVFRHAGRCFVDLYSSLHNPDKIKKKVSCGTPMDDLIKNSQEKSFGAFVVAPHLSNFDLCILAIGYNGLRAQILTYGQPTGGYQIQNKIRLQTGLDIIPVNQGVHEKAVEYMRNGGLVITGVDRPIQRKTHKLSFFNRPSPLPAGHIRMALQAEVPILVASASMDGEGQYHIHLSEPIHLQRKNDPKVEIRLNGERVLTVIEDRIRKNPGQWLMFYPAWPEVEISNFTG
jgi:KDO2-lipid IV(A) lauroyltransferase